MRARGAVLVALADGEMVEDEALAIERIFAPLVPDFRRVLDREVALEVFYKTGGIVSAHGPATLRSLFQLLVHVMVADGRTDEREAAMVLAIGEALGYLPMFESWLDAALHGLGVSFPKVVERPVLPLPPRRRTPWRRSRPQRRPLGSWPRSRSRSRVSTTAWRSPS